MRHLQIDEFQTLHNPKERYDKIWSDLSGLEEPRKNTKAYRVWQDKKEHLLAELMEVEKDLEKIGQSAPK
ncbi:MAG: hypothetical protein KKB04_02905 [Candidatus Thermoplasmatota archaeon]|nr:hypothetical protein [Candidatus Thermoplasmatota archaeon]